MIPETSLSVIICTHKPHQGRLGRTLRGLAAQSLATDTWECLVVDNASGQAFPALNSTELGLPTLRVVQEPRLGLSHARRRGCLEAKGEILLFVDDDNVLHTDYLKLVLKYFTAHAGVGALGGKSLPEFEVPAPAWIKEFFGLLALRDLGPTPLFSGPAKAGPLQSYPECSPIGAGMAARKTALASWLNSFSSDALPDRKGNSLSSGGDNDIVAHLLEAGWQVAYFPDLVLTHLIPEGRLQVDYLGRLNRGIQESWMRVLSLHGINPWQAIPAWTLPLRKARAYLRRQAWKGGPEWIRWQSDCGHFDGCAKITRP